MRVQLFACLIVAIVSSNVFAQGVPQARTSGETPKPIAAATPRQGLSGSGTTKVDGQGSAKVSRAGTPGVQSTQTSDEEFSVRVKTMEEQVNDLKEKIYRTKARLMLLQESILGGGSVSQGAKAVLVHRNEMGASYYLESAAYALDGAPVFTKVDIDGDLDKKQELEIFNGRIVPGQHQIAVKFQFRGHGFGIFSYLEGYKFKVQSSYTFDAEPGKTTNLGIVAHEQGGLTTDLKERPAVRYDLERSVEAASTKVVDDQKIEPGTASKP